jgi:hypothetical protein
MAFLGAYVHDPWRCRLDDDTHNTVALLMPTMAGRRTLLRETGRNNSKWPSLDVPRNYTSARDGDARATMVMGTVCGATPVVSGCGGSIQLLGEGGSAGRRDNSANEVTLGIR